MSELIESFTKPNRFIKKMWIHLENTLVLMSESLNHSHN